MHLWDLWYQILLAFLLLILLFTGNCFSTFKASERYVIRFISSHRHAGFLLGLFFSPMDGADMLRRNVRWLPADHTALYRRRYKLLHRHLSETLQSYDSEMKCSSVSWRRKDGINASCRDCPSWRRYISRPHLRVSEQTVSPPALCLSHRVCRSSASFLLYVSSPYFRAIWVSSLGSRGSAKGIALLSPQGFINT
jgi:hypothetical protein